ncbi:hypothetical protein FRB96_004117 [Tulasnella sp. 330]|nr:hypothetical protein FRB96_004117 [Tulasnella sp. 330]KAG8876644.1 hypothetical protein FRB97_004009 [Tulasnella sp. 331]KAG8880233.1 hypothetical protein FRB98_005276 [Tulasnella sp. 332]
MADANGTTTSTAADAKMDDAKTRKRPRLDLEVEPRKKTRSVFGQVFGTLRKARDQDSKEKTSDSVKKRIEIDTRIMGKITREQITVRKQDEAKRDRVMANRKEEDLAIKDGILRLRQAVFPRLAGFLLTTDVFPQDEDSEHSTEAAPTAILNHPPPSKQPPALYYLPATLTPAQDKFLAKQKAEAAQVISEEMKEWAVDRKKGVEEVADLRRKAAENSMLPPPPANTDDVSPSRRQRSESIATMEIEEEKVGDSGGGLASVEEQSLVHPEKEKSVMDAEDTIEY